MRPIARDVAHSAVCVSLSVLGTRVSCAKPVGPIEMPFGRQTRVGPRKCVLHGDPDPPTGRGTFEGHVAHCKYRDMSAFRIFRLPPPANVPAQRTRRTNAFSAARGDK